MKTSSFSFRPSAVETQVQYRAALPRDGRAKRVPTIPRGLPRGTFILTYGLLLVFLYGSAALSQTGTLCSASAFKTECLLARAHKKADKESCAAVRRVDLRANDFDVDSCYMDVVRMTHDSTICKDIHSSTTRDGCYGLVAEKTQQETLCEPISDATARGRCFLVLAHLKRDPKLCPRASAPSYGELVEAYEYCKGVILKGVPGSVEAFSVSSLYPSSGPAGTAVTISGTLLDSVESLTLVPPPRRTVDGDVTDCNILVKDFISHDAHPIVFKIPVESGCPTHGRVSGVYSIFVASPFGGFKALLFTVAP